MPPWALVIGQFISWPSGLPVLLVTAFGTLTMSIARASTGRSSRQASVSSATAGWAIGVIPAIADGTIEVNSFMHNTQSVSGHFHTYLLLGMIAMFLGFLTSTPRSIEQTCP